MNCKDLMTKQPKACTPNDTCQTVAKILREDDIGSLPVVDDRSNGRVIGIITDRDICCRVAAEGKDAGTVLVRDAMTENVACCREEDRVEEAERMMQECQIRRIPVTDKDGRLAGVIAQADVARSRPSEIASVVQAVSRPTVPTIQATARAG